MCAAPWVLAACPAPPPPPPPPQPKPEPEPEPPPPPKCEAFKDKCKADSSTEARIADSGYVFTPPKGWVYAQLSSVTIAQKSGDGPVIVMTSYKPEKGFKATQQRSDKIGEMAKEAAIKPATSRPQLRTGQPREVDSLKFELWDGFNSTGLTDAKREDKKGPLLVLTAKASDDVQLFGVAWVPKGDKDAIGGILKAIESVKVGAGDGDEDDEDKDKDDK